MSKITTHAECKDSGAEWLGSVPKHWDIVKFRHHFQESPEKISNEVVGVMLSVSGYRGIEIKQYDDEIRRRSLADLLNYRIVRPSQLVVNSMWLNAAGLGVSSFEGHVSPAYRSYWISDAFCLRYVHHLLRSSVYVDFYTSRVQGIRPNSLQLGRRDLMNLMVLLPPKDEQKQIAAFLDFETAKIDALIEKQQQLIALLGEKRQAVISHAVTKGLNPDAPMRDSGVEWLGEVPEHWNVSRIKHLCYVNDGNHGEEYPKADDYADEEDGVPFIRGGNMQDFQITNEGMLYLTKRKNASMRKGRLQAGDVLFMNRGDIGKLALISDDHAGSNLNSQIAYLRCERDDISNRFLLYFLASDLLRSHVASLKMGSVLTQFPIADIVAIPVPLPNAHEQQQIVAHIERHKEKLDELVAKAATSLELLQERRTALISAAVTGKIDVRGWKRPSADSTLETEMEVA